jgi:CubicO group peptidase (beta-lactamase class C family)
MGTSCFVARFLLSSATGLFLCDLQVIAADPFAGMDPYIHQAMKKWEVPGLAIAVIKDDKVVLLRGYGVGELGTDRKVTGDTPFTIASCTKSFTATALAMLMEEGKLKWDDPGVKHLPGFELYSRELTEHVTLRDLLVHRTGLPGCDMLGEGAGFDPQTILSRLKYIPPVAELRTRHIYSNWNYTALGEVVAHVSGKPHDAFVAERIFKPLGMDSTTFDPVDIPPGRLALRHWRSDAGIVARPAPRIGGGIYSTVRDMAQWLKLQLAEGTYEGRQLLKPETIRETHALQFSIPIKSRPQGNIYAAHFLGSGLGWVTQDYRGRKIVLHTGAWGAITAMMPDEKLGVVVLSNLDLESIAGLLMYDVFDAYLVGPESAWNADKWEATWLRNEPPGYAYRPRDEAKARLEKTRVPNTKPKLPLQDYAGKYESKLYGTLAVRHEKGRLSVTFGEFTSDLSHWQDESFYVRTPNRLTFDWLLTFGRSPDGKVDGVTVKHIGWGTNERDHFFLRNKP